MVSAATHMDQDLRQIADRTAGLWLDTREGELRTARAAGKRAASSDMALLQRRLADFQDGLLGRAKAAVLTLQSDLTAHVRDLHRQIEELARERDEHIGQRIAETREERQRALQGLGTSKGPASAPYSRAAQALEEAERTLRNVRAQVDGRPLRRSLVHVYLPCMIALALVEVPVNRLAFELFFQEQPIFSLALAAAVGAVLIFFAHICGLLARRMEQPSPRLQQVKRVVVLAVFLLLTGTTMTVLARMRQLYVQLLEAEGGSSLQQMVEQFTRGGTASAIAHVNETQLGTAGWTLLLLNVMLFVFGATASFLRHDPHPDYEPAWRAQDRARRRVTALKKQYDAALGTRQKGFDQSLAAQDQLLRETQAKHDELLARAAAAGPFFTETVARIANSVRNRALAFLEGAIGDIPKGPISGSIDTIRTMPEPEVLRAIAGGMEPPA